MKFLLFLFFPVVFWAQTYQPFTGKLVYKIEFTYADTVGNPPKQTSYQTIFTNDTIVRVEAESAQLGSQVTIRHMELNKYYILLNLQGRKFAIQHQGIKDTTESKYQFIKKRGSKTFCGIKAKKLEVKDTKSGLRYIVYYFPKYSPKYTEALRGICGLPVSYDIFAEEGTYHYELIDFKQEAVSKDLFGIPSNYEKISFDDFLKIISPQN